MTLKERVQHVHIPLPRLHREGTGAAGPAPVRRRSGPLLFAAWCGVAGPVLFALSFLLVQTTIRSEHAWAAEPVAALTQGDWGWVMQSSFALFGVLTLVFAAGLHRGLRPARLGWTGPALFALTGLALLWAATIPWRDVTGGYDPVAGGGFFFGTALALLLVTVRMARDPAWRSLSSWTGAAGLLGLALALVIGLLAAPDNGIWHDQFGALQQLGVLLLLFPARIALGLRLGRVARQEPRVR